MTLHEVAKEFKRHYKKAMKLKEGGKAWEREINLANKYLEIGKKQYEEELKERYGGWWNKSIGNLKEILMLLL